MFIDLGCGKCDSSLIIDGDDDLAIWMMLYRFTNAHLECGFVSPTLKSDIPIDEIKRKPLKPRLHAEDE